MGVDASLGATLARGFGQDLVHWPLVRSSAVFELRYGKALVDANRRPGPVPVFGTNGRCGSHDTRLFKGPGVVCGRKGQGPLGVEWVDSDYWVIDTAYSLLPLRDDVDLKFAYYLVKYVGLNHLKDGTSNPTLSRDSFGSQLFPHPPLSQQRAIARILGTLDDKIELNRKMNETLEAMARALFKSWFVDFDPVRAKAEGRAPSGMGAETAKVFPSELVESELGPIPKGWRWAPLGDWAEALSGGTPSKANAAFWKGSLKWISPKAMTSIHADECDDYVTPLAVGNGTRLAPKGSTLVMVRGMGLHDGVRVSQAREAVTFNQDVKALVPGDIDADLLLFAMLDAQAELHKRVETSGHGTGKIPSEILLAHPITMPRLGEQSAFAGHFRVLNDRIAHNRAESRTLARLRDGLLPRLLSGELVSRGW